MVMVILLLDLSEWKVNFNISFIKEYNGGSVLI
jgi:hypothetical protein